jgi:hypothetical protein
LDIEESRIWRSGRTAYREKRVGENQISQVRISRVHQSVTTVGLLAAVTATSFGILYYGILQPRYEQLAIATARIEWMTSVVTLSMLACTALFFISVLTMKIEFPKKFTSSESHEGPVDLELEEKRLPTEEMVGMSGSTSVDTKYCIFCGRKVPLIAEYCEKCGKKLKM